jgi:hypothetical protein
MGINKFKIPFHLNSEPEKVCLLKKDKDKEEINFFLSIHEFWNSKFVSDYGAISFAEHISNPDDPPDIRLNCEKGVLGFELFSLGEERIGRHNSIVREADGDNAFTVFPTLSNPVPKNPKKALNYAFGAGNGEGWVNPEQEYQAWLKVGWEKLHEKLQKALHPKSPAHSIDYVAMNLSDQKNSAYINRDEAMRMSRELFEKWKLHGGQKIGVIFYWWLNKDSFWSLCWDGKELFQKTA